MSKLGVSGFLFLMAGFLLLCFQFISAALKLGPSNEFVYKNVRLIDVLNSKYFSWINDIASSYIQNIAESLIKAPLIFWFGGIACMLFFIQAFKRVK